MNKFLIPLMIALCAAGVSAQLRQLTVVSEPNAQIWIDDVNYGRTGKDGRLKLRTFTAGIHKLRVRADGFKEVSQPLAATAKGDVKVALAKTTDPAELAFQQAEAMSAIDRDKAVALYKKAVQLDPKNAAAYVGMARAYSQNEVDEALAAIRSARKLRPAYAEASAVEGRIYKDLGEEEKSVASFKRAITEGRGVQPEAHTGLGLIYKERAESAGTNGDFDTEKSNYALAAAELRKAAAQLAGAPDNVTVYQLLGDSYERAKMYAEANKIYEEFIRNFPDTPEVTTFRSFIVQNTKRINGEN